MTAMREVIKLRISAIWFALVLATCLSWESVQGFAWAQDPRLATTTVIAIAFVKVRFVALDFMELRHAPLALRLFFEFWVIGLAAAMIGLYWILSPAG